MARSGDRLSDSGYQPGLGDEVDHTAIITTRPRARPIDEPRLASMPLPDTAPHDPQNRVADVAEGREPDSLCV